MLGRVNTKERDSFICRVKQLKKSAWASSSLRRLVDHEDAGNTRLLSTFQSTQRNIPDDLKPCGVLLIVISQSEMPAQRLILTQADSRNLRNAEEKMHA
jgi:hypothetical protein